MAAAEESPPETYLSFYNVDKSKLVYVSTGFVDQLSPSPSALSEGSVDFLKGKLHYGESSSNSEEEDSAEELTSLSWLTQLKNLVEWPNSINPIIDDEADNRNDANRSTTSSFMKKDSLIDRFQKFVEQARQNREVYNKSAALYQMDANEKPPFNYAQMIAMAMLENGRMTLQNIYSWIQTNFGYYRARNNWNNSIRHNLSLQFCFRKIDRNVYNKGDGKGGYWELGIDANKSERKRIRNRAGMRSSQKLSRDETEPKRKRPNKGCTFDELEPFKSNPTHDITNPNEKDYLMNRTLNSINASVNFEQPLNSDDLGIGSIIEVSSEVALVAPENGFERKQQQDAIGISETPHEFHVLNDISQTDYLNISTLDLMSSGDDIFENGDFEATTCGPEGLSSLSSSDSHVPAMVATLVDSTAQCSNEILLASEVPQPSESVVISELDRYENVSALRIHSTNFIIDDTGIVSENDENNLIKSFNFDGIDHEFQLLPSCIQNNRDDMIEVFFNILPQQEF